MLKDPKAKAFSRNFAAQWLDLAGIRRLAVNPEYFVFEETTKDLFEEETVRFLHHVLSEDLSIDNFIHSDFVVINHKLAKHYRIPGIGGGFQVRQLGPEHRRGGFLTQASMLFGNSTGSETHPFGAVCGCLSACSMIRRPSATQCTRPCGARSSG